MNSIPKMRPSDGIEVPRLTAQDRMAMASVMVSIALAVLDTAIANTALPTIAGDLGVSAASSIWVINAYQLAAVATLLPFATLGSVLGERRVYLLGLVGFTLSSAACTFSHTLTELVLCRVLQGIGASAIMSVNTALIARIYPASILGRGLGLNALVVGISFAIGPTAASILLSLGPWQWLFGINIPIGVIAVVLSWATLPRSERRHTKFDVVAGVLTAITFAALIYGLGSAAQEAPLRYTITALVVFVVACLSLVRYERGSVAPMLPLDLFSSPLFALSALTAFCAFATQGLAFVALPFFLEHSLGMAAEHTGFVMSPWSVVVALVAPIAGRLSDRVAPGLLGSAGLAMLAVGMALLAPTIIWLNVVAIVACMAMCGAGFGLFQSPNLKALMSSAPRSRSAGASGVVATARLIGQASGAALVALCFGIAGTNGPAVALGLGCGFAAVGSLASASRLLVARTH